MLEFNSQKIVGKAEVNVTIEVALTEEQVSDIMVGAIEGGVNYWASIRRDSEWDSKPSDEPASMWATHLLLTGKQVQFYDYEDPTEEIDPLTLEKLVEGYAKQVAENPIDADLEQADANTYDNIIQYALFGQLVYG